MEKTMNDAAMEGDLLAFNTLIQQDPLILHRLPSTFHVDTPLHVSVLRGHTEFTRALLSHNPNLAAESDSLGRLPLHIAAAKGHLEITRELLRVEGGVSGCAARDKDGMMPVHVAIVKGGRVEVVSELTQASPESTRARGERGESVYHLCVKYNNLEALNVLLMSENNYDINEGDDFGNTLFHLAALHKHFEIIKYLLTRPGIEPNAVNKNGLTALDLIENSPRDIKTLEILNFLLESNAQNPDNSSFSTRKAQGYNNRTGIRTRSTNTWKNFFTFNDESLLEKFRGELFVVSAMIILIVALPVINQKINPDAPVIDDTYFIGTMSLVSAMSIMFILVSGLPLKNKFCIWLVLQLLYTAIGFWGLNYFAAMLSNESRYYEVGGTVVLMYVWSGLLVMVSLLNTIRLIVLIVTSVKRCVTRKKLRGIRRG